MLQRLTGSPRTRVVVLLAMLATVSLAGRLYTYREPLERDLAAYAIVGHELRQGRLLYSDLWDHKPPAIHAVFAVADAVVGYGRPAVFALNVTTALLTLPAIYLLGSAAGMGARSGLWAASLWTLLALNLPLEANQPNVEVFVNLCLSWALVPLLRFPGPVVSWGTALIVGVLAAAASLFKQIAILPVLAVQVAYVTGGLWKPRLKRAVVMVLVPFLAWIGLAAYFAGTGRFTDFYSAVFGYNRTYAGDFRETIIAAVQPGPMAFAAIAAIPSILVIFSRFQRSAGPGVIPHWLVLAFAAGTAVQVALPGQWHPHYFQLWLPSLAIAFGWGVGLLRKPRQPWVVDVAAALLLVPLIIITAGQFRLNPQEWSLRKYGPDFVATEEAARRVRELLLPGEVFFHLGSHPGLYLETKQRPIAGVFYLPIPKRRHPLYALEAGPLVGSRADEVLAALQQTRPDLLVLSIHTVRTLAARAYLREHPIVRWCREHYVPLPDQGGGRFFFFYAYRESALAQRSRAAD